MTGTFDVNTLASWSAVVLAIAAAFGGYHKLGRWLESVDARFENQDERFKAQAEEIAEVWRAVDDSQRDTRDRLEALDAQMRPNGGGSHHDLMVRTVGEAVREAVLDATDDERGRPRRRRRHAW